MQSFFDWHGQYVQSASWNGADLGGQAWLPVAEVHAKGGTIAFVMGATPNAKWGSVRPPSYKKK